MSCAFTVTDCFGRQVTLDHANWQWHVTKRPAIAPFHELLPLVLAEPHIVIEAGRDGHYHFYRRGFPTVHLRRVWLRVVVEYFGQAGKVKTVWLSRTIDPGKKRWPRRRRR